MTAAALLASVGLLIANGGFVALEFGLIAGQRSRIDARADAGSRTAKVAQRLQSDVLTTLGGAQLGITLCSVGLGRLGEPAVAHLIEPPLSALGMGEGAVHVTGFVLALGLVTILHMVLAEMMPKNLALVGPERTLLVLARPMRAYLRVAKLPVRALQWVSEQLLRFTGVQLASEMKDRVSADEFELMVRTSASEQLLSSEAPQLVASALVFHETRAAEVATPLAEVPTVTLGEQTDAVEQALAAAHQSRLLVLDADGSVAGYVHAAHLAGSERSHVLGADQVWPVHRLNAAATLGDVVAALRPGRPSLVLVDTEAGTGVVHLDDIVAALLRRDVD